MVVGMLVCLVGTAYGAGIVLKIRNNDLGDKTPAGGTNPTYTGPGSVDTANIEFFHGSVPASPTSTANRIPYGLVPAFNYTRLADYFQYDDTAVNGGNVYVRSWDGTPRTRGSNYGISPAYAAASGASPANQWTVPKFQAGYLADVPRNTPTINSVSESNVRVGDTTDVVLSLSIGYSYSPGDPPNTIIATGYDVKYWLGTETEPSDTDPNRVVSTGSTSWGLPERDPKTGNKFGSGTYNFRVRAKNEFGAGPWSATRSWPTLTGVGGGGIVTLSFSLKAYEANKLVVNSISVPPNLKDGTGTPITTASKLIARINELARENIVIVLGKWDPETGNAVRLTPGGVGNDFDLKPGEGYQLYVTKDYDLTLQGTP